MEPGFRICPFCQSPTPLDEERCPECHRSLAGLPLKIHHVPSRSPEGAPAVEPATDRTPTPTGGTVLGSSDRRTGRSRRAAEPSRSRRMPFAFAGSFVMALALGWIALRAIDHDPKDSDTAAAAPVATAPLPATLPAAPRVRATAPPASVPTPAATSEPTTATATATTAPTPTPTPMRIVVHPRVSAPAIPETGAEYERFRRARRAALELAESRRDALLRRVERMEDQLALIEDPDAHAQMQATLDAAQAQLEAADKEVARLQREIGE